MMLAPPHAVVLRRMLLRLVGLAAGLAATACSSPTDAASSVAALSISGPGTLIVHESRMFVVVATNANGQAMAASKEVKFSSSDPAVATVSPDGVVTGAARGTATIVAQYDAAIAQATVAVRARVTVTPARGQEWAEQVSLAPGDSLHLVAWFTDVNGATIGPAPVTAWQSSNPSAMSVDSAGLVIAHTAGEQATISAQTADGSAALELSVEVIGQPAHVRFAHVAPGVGPITFRASHLLPVTLEYGQSVELPVTSGDFYVETDGLPAATYYSGDFRTYIPPGAVLSLYAAASSGWFSQLTPAWSTTDPIPRDSALVRFIQSSAFPVLRLRGAAEPGLGALLQCYFDPGDPSDYYTTAAGALDVIVQEKPSFYFDSTAAHTALPATLAAGHAVTLVLTGSTLASAGYLVFPDR